MTQSPDVVRRRSLRNLFILPRIQGGYVGVPIFAGVFLILLYSVTVFSHISIIYQILSNRAMASLGGRDSLQHLFVLTLIGLGACSLFFLVGVAGLLLFQSHRVAGPLYHFHRVIRDVSAGNHSARIKLRKQDQLQELAKDFNEMLDSIQKKKDP